MSVSGTLAGRRRALLAIATCLLVLPVVQPRSASSDLVTVIVSKVVSTDPTPEQVVRHVGGRVERELSIIDGFVARVPRAAVDVLAGIPGVRSVSPDRGLHLLAQYGQDSGVASAVYTDVVRAGKTWGTGDSGAGVGVAVIDTGVDTSGNLAGQVAHAEDFTSD